MKVVEEFTNIQFSKLGIISGTANIN